MVVPATVDHLQDVFDELLGVRTGPADGQVSSICNDRVKLKLATEILLRVAAGERDLRRLKQEVVAAVYHSQQSVGEP